MKRVLTVCPRCGTLRTEVPRPVPYLVVIPCAVLLIELGDDTATDFPGQRKLRAGNHDGENNGDGIRIWRIAENEGLPLPAGHGEWYGPLMPPESPGVMKPWTVPIAHVKPNRTIDVTFSPLAARVLSDQASASHS
jgi:hypothetical protein